MQFDLPSDHLRIAAEARLADDQGVEPANHYAERALRGAVIYRKLSLGSQSDRGERRIDRALARDHNTVMLGRRLDADKTAEHIVEHSFRPPVIGMAMAATTAQ